MNNQPIITISTMLAMLSGFMTVHSTFLAITLEKEICVLLITIFLILTIIFGGLAGYHLKEEEQ